MREERKEEERLWGRKEKRKKIRKDGRKEGRMERRSWEGRCLIAFNGAYLSTSDLNAEVHFLGNPVIRLSKANCVMMEVQCINKYVDPLHAFVVACTKKKGFCRRSNLKLSYLAAALQACN
jgi:hypothetical protein